MNRTTVHSFVKMITLITIFFILGINFAYTGYEVKALDTNPNTEMIITIHDWNTVSVNNSEFTNMITDVPVEDIRAQMDSFGDKDGEVDDWEVAAWSRGLEGQINEDFRNNKDEPSHTFQMLLDERTGYGDFNYSHVYLGGMVGPITSTAPVTFSIEIFLDYTDTDISKSSHLVKLNLGEFIDESQIYFKHVKLKLPANWRFNTTMLSEDFPDIFYEDDSLMNITAIVLLDEDSKFLANHIKDIGMLTERYEKPSNGGGPKPNGNGNGGENGDDDEEFFLDTNQLIAVIAIIAVVAVAGAAFYLKRKED